MLSPQNIGGTLDKKKDDNARGLPDILFYFTRAQRAFSGPQGAGLEEENREPQAVHGRDGQGGGCRGS